MLKFSPKLIYMLHITWCVFRKVMNERFFSNLLQPFQMHCDFFLPWQCTCRFSTLDEQCFLWIFRWFYGLLYQWHPHFMTAPFFIHAYPFKSSCYLNKWFWLCIRCHTSTTWKWQLFFLVKITLWFMIRIFWLLCMFLRNGIIYSKFNMKSLCIFIFFIVHVLN
jgi:hypothetical protein